MIADVMTRGVEVVDPEASIQQAAIAMAERDVGAVIVGVDERPLGIVTDRDILLRAVVKGLDLTTTPVATIMSSLLFTCSVEDDPADLLRAMDERQVRRVPVLDAAGRVTGIVVRSDLTSAPPTPPGLKPDQAQELKPA